MDKITIQKAKVMCSVGITAEERAVKQELFIDIDLFVDCSKCVDSDDIKDTVNYYALFDQIRGVIEDGSYNLIERVASVICDLILEDNLVKKVIVKVMKSGAIPEAQYASVELVRSRIEFVKD